MKFSSAVTELTEMWLLWMKNHAIAINPYLDVDLREKASDECERLISREYELVAILDGYMPCKDQK